MTTRILVWDLPTRVFHWALAASFAGAFLTAESERYRDVHVLLGYTVLALIAFRLLWGLAGTRYARFTDFVRGPRAAGRYLLSLVMGQPEHHTGHNPAGGIAILLLLALGLASGLSGWAVYEDLGGDWLAEVHETVSNAMLAVVVIHVVAVVLSSLLHRENLARSMVTGTKLGEPSEAIRGSRPLVALLLVGAIAAIGWLALPGAGDAPAGATATASAHVPGQSGRPKDDD